MASKQSILDQPAGASAIALVDADALAAALLDRVADLIPALNVGQEPEPFWAPDQAAAYMACDRQRIYDLHSQGVLRCAKDGGRLLTRRSWIDDYLEGRS